mmetsp:Transcript_60529/g.170551  ORF Transcript_60529/g.170551 Transcript_60529/m.170551 type:complete len:323 (-) Transcript_60529:30-998(-)
MRRPAGWPRPLLVCLHAAVSVSLYVGPAKPYREEVPVINSFQFIRIPKTGSTSFLDVLVRIMQKTNPNATITREHAHRSSLSRTTMPAPIFHVTLLRDPVERCLSSYYYRSMKKNWVPVDKVTFLNNCSDFQSHYIAPSEGALEQIKTVTAMSLHATDAYTNQVAAAKALAKDVVHSYDFIGITERFNESLVLLQHQLGLNTAHVLYLRKKSSGADYKGNNPNRTGVIPRHPPLSEEPPEVQQAAEALRARSIVETEVIDKVNKKMDKQIAKIGPQFALDLMALRTNLDYVAQFCRGDEEPCWHNDIGCAQGCMDRVCMQVY